MTSNPTQPASLLLQGWPSATLRNHSCAAVLLNLFGSETADVRWV